MINGKKVVVIMPAYNAEKTLKQTYDEIYKDFVDEVILVDDNSQDNTKIVSKELNIKTIVHKENKGYGANQKSCYKAALKSGADIVVMLHPDYQYTPKLIPAIVCMMAFEQYDAVLASRMLGNSALKGGMPLYKFIANHFLTWFENIFTGEKLSEYHTGFRGFTKDVLEKLPLAECNDDFIFDNEMIALLFYNKYNIGELSCPTKYFKEASSINFIRSCKYGLGVLMVSIQYRLAKLGIRSKIFKPDAKKLDLSTELEYYYQ
ncbi:TPA: glycosyltransferase family 2 protein [Candidatus Scatousia excrementigallinarum]|uniref:Glycosyltransferase family 2 protein n=1 Tax=Candidatus Scatousia excrementigallinarum TaxID=2840935 RepID=A0A9D1F1D5_9BACT|nr:glycosyltransferase family 2 protein [Candidatus Scatousia excrementigallinarum]